MKLALCNSSWHLYLVIIENHAKGGKCSCIMFGFHWLIMQREVTQVDIFYISAYGMGLSSFHTRHTCAMCQKTFRRPAELARHMRIHTGEKPFECSECGRRFTQKSGLTTHKFSVHGICERVRFKETEGEPVPWTISSPQERNPCQYYQYIIIWRRNQASYDTPTAPGI